MDSFGDLLAKALKRKSLSQSEFARLAKLQRSVVSELIKSKRKPPLRRAEDWADLLDIPKDERLAWQRAAALARADQIVAHWVQELETELARVAARRR